MSLKTIGCYDSVPIEEINHSRGVIVTLAKWNTTAGRYYVRRGDYVSRNVVELVSFLKEQNVSFKVSDIQPLNNTTKQVDIMNVGPKDIGVITSINTHDRIWWL